MVSCYSAGWQGYKGFINLSQALPASRLFLMADFSTSNLLASLLISTPPARWTLFYPTDTQKEGPVLYKALEPQVQ